ncbi:MAG TPA: alcohol dehydrogenase catalytic domain-containing protein [Streptosporangiaceae bacterium]|jgi:hypothetical protein
MKALVFRHNLAREAASTLGGRIDSRAFVSRFAPVRIEEVEDLPLPAPDWVRVRTTFSGLCGSDVKQILLNGSRDNPLTALVSFPHVLGHEVAGRRMDTGERVVLNPWLSCGPRGIDPPCVACRDGRYPWCRNFRSGDLPVSIHLGNCAAAAGAHAERFAAHPADVVVMAASAIETVRLALLSSFPDRSGKLGRRLMLHSFIDGTAIFTGERMHAYRGRSTTQCAEDAADPDFPGARAYAKANHLPYIRGGIMELGGSQDPISEAQSYQTLLRFVRPGKPFGTDFKQLMRASVLRDRLAGCSMVGSELPYLSHTVTLDAAVKDVFGLPVARITWSAGPYEQIAQQFYIPLLKTMMRTAGAAVALAVPATINSSGLPTGSTSWAAQPDQHDHGGGPAQHAQPGRKLTHFS